MVATAAIFVPRLSDTSYVDHQFFAAERKSVIAVFRSDEFTVRGEYSRDVCVALETVLGDLCEQTVHLVAIINRFVENIFVRRVAR